jgi:hypothetical protein
VSVNILDADSDELLDEDAAAVAVGKRNKRTLKRWRDFGEGPPFIKVGRTIYYRRQAIRDWLLSQEQKTRRVAV